MNAIGRRLRVLRQQKKLSQKEFGKVFDLAESTIGMYERDERKPDYDTLSKIADYYGVSVDFLLGRTDNKERQIKLTSDEEFEAFANDPELERWYKELPNSKEDDLQALKQMWEIIKKNKK